MTITILTSGLQLASQEGLNSMTSLHIFASCIVQFWTAVLEEQPFFSCQNNLSSLFLFSLFSCIRKKKDRLVKSPCCVCLRTCMPSPFQQLNQLADFHKTLYERYAVKGHPEAVILNFLQYIVTSWRTFKYMWDESGISVTYFRVLECCMRIDLGKEYSVYSGKIFVECKITTRRCVKIFFGFLTDGGN
jgi:hypothetical protein